MSAARIIRILFGVLAAALLIAAVGDIALNGRLTLMPPAMFAALFTVVIAFLLHSFLAARERNALLNQQAAQLKTVASRLEASLAAAAQMNARLNQSEARYKALVDSQGDAIFRRSADSRLTYGNDAFFKLFGLNPQAAIGRPFAPELHPESRAPLFGSFAGLETGKARVRYDQYLRTAYGWRWIAWEDYAVRDSLGRLVEVQSVGRDVTERKALEDALTEARDKAEAASRAKSGFLATMSHEIRTPMNGVLGMARLLRETKLSPEQRTYVEAIAQSGEALLALIGDILDFSKIESGTLTLEEDTLDPRALMEGVVELLAPRAHAKAIELVAVAARDVPAEIRADGVRLRQVLTNLAGNAVKFTETGGVRLSVGLRDAGGRSVLRFEVRDTGVGVPLEKRQEIFDEFVQADSSHARRFGGTGLGLAISRKLVAAMGGEIGVDGADGGGSLFWFTLPALVAAAPAETGEALKGLRIGLVTQNAILGEGLAEQIREAGGLTGFLTPGTSASFDYLLIDAGTAAEPEAPTGPLPAIPSFVLLTSAARAAIGGMRKAGFAGYLVKPVRAATLAERLKRHRSGGADPESASVAPAEPPVAAQSRLSVLLAEDNAINAMLIRELLRRRGHAVAEVTSGEAAVKAAAERRFDLILTDIHMPGMDGIEATRAIRASEAETGRARTPIVALTADALETGREACREAGMDGFLTKPVDPNLLDEMFAAFFPAPAETQAETAAETRAA